MPHQQQKFLTSNFSLTIVCHVYTCYLLFNLFDSLTGGRTLFIANTSTLLKTAQLYEFQAETSQDKEKCVYVCQICKTMI